MNISHNRGFIKYIVIFIIFIIILGYFNIDIRGIVESPQTQKNMAYGIEIGTLAWQKFLKPVWDNYLSEPVLYFWQNIFVDVLWKAFTEGLKALESGDFNTPIEQLNIPEI